MDAAVLKKLNDQLSPFPSQLGFQAGVAIAQAILPDEDNAKGGMKHADVLYVEKSYDTVDRHLLLNLTGTWLDT